MVQISDTIRLMASYDPAGLQALRRRHPESIAIFQPDGEVLGKTSDRPMFDAAQSALAIVSSLAPTAMTATQRKLRAARRLELGGAILALLSSGGVVGLTVGLNSLWGAAACGVIGFCSSGIPLFTGWLRGLDTGEGTVAENFVRLRECAWDAQMIQRELVAATDHDGQARLIERANSIARTMYVTLSNLGYSPGVSPGMP